jgi:PAS domain S-box-containing protein
MTKVVFAALSLGFVAWVTPGLIETLLGEDVPQASFWGTSSQGLLVSRLVAAVTAASLPLLAARRRRGENSSKLPLLSAQRWRKAADRVETGLLLVEATADERGGPLDGRLVEANSHALRLLGITRDDLANMAFSQLFPSGRRERISESLRRALETEKPVQLEDFGSARLLDDRVLNAVAYSLDPNHLVVHVSDVSEIRRADLALRESEERFRALFHESRDGVYSVTRDGHFIEINQVGLDMLEASREDLAGRTSDSFYADPAERRRFQAEIEQSGSVKDFEVTLRSRNGRLVHCLLTSTILRNRQGETIGYQGIMHDITARKEAERALQESERRFRATFEQAAVGIAHVAADGRLLSANQKLCTMLGYDREDLLQHRLQDLSSPDTSDEEQAWQCDLLEGHISTFSREKELARRDGSTIWVTQTVSALRKASGEIEYFIYVLADITEQKRLEEQYRQSQKMEALGRLAGGVAHDFNNLLTGLMGYSELALHELAEDSAAAGYLREVLGLGKKARDLTGHLLSFSRPQSQRLVSVNVTQLIREDVRMLQRTLGENIELVFEPAESLFPVQVDPGQLQQVLLNLAINARDAMPTGGRLTIRTFESTSGAEALAFRQRGHLEPAVCISVSDTGHGMDKETMERIFEPFFTTKAAGIGTGLGLAMVHGIVTKHGGKISVVSSPGNGSTFTLSFPRASRLVATAPSTLPFPAEPCGGNETILLVEDEPAVRALIERVLGRLGYRVLSAGNPAEAQAIFQKQRDEIALLLTDVMMPGQTGVELASNLRQTSPGLKVVFISGYMHREDLAKAVLGSGTPFVQKPFQPSELAAKLREVLDQS